MALLPLAIVSGVLGTADGLRLERVLGGIVLQGSLSMSGSINLIKHLPFMWRGLEVEAMEWKGDRVAQKFGPVSETRDVCSHHMWCVVQFPSLPWQK
jgi:hypothetical protein